jgi:predicted metal-dependent enzyme (double-stranded beta helix superfamily)
MKLLYKPFGVVAGVVAGMMAGAVFKQIWKLVADEEDKPDATDRNRGWTEVVSAAAIQGAVFGGVKAAVDRAGATGFERITGTWPGNTEPPEKNRA